MLFETLDDAFEFIREVSDKVGNSIAEYKITWWSWEQRWNVGFEGNSARDHDFNEE